jgi:hypothetical protein
MRRIRTGRRIEISARDIELFKILARYRYLRSTFLYAFLGGASETRFKERLGDLYHEGGYIDRPKQQWQFANCRSTPIIYELGEAGARVLRDMGAAETDSVLFGQDRRGPCRQFLHAVMICDILGSIEIGVRNDPALRLISWPEILAKAPEKTLRMAKPFELSVSISYTFPKTGKTEQAHTKVVPDALFGLEYQTGEQKSYRFFALEADRATMPVVRGNLRQTSYLKKILAYREVAARKLYQTQLGIPNLLVLTVTTSDRHQDTIMQIVQEVTRGSRMFLFKTMTSLGGVQSAPSPASQVLTSPWQRAGLATMSIDTST